MFISLEARDFQLKARCYLVFFLPRLILLLCLWLFCQLLFCSSTSLINGGFQGLVLDQLIILSSLTTSAITSVHSTQICSSSPLSVRYHFYFLAVHLTCIFFWCLKLNIPQNKHIILPLTRSPFFLKITLPFSWLYRFGDSPQFLTHQVSGIWPIFFLVSSLLGTHFPSHYTWHIPSKP